MPRFVLAVGGRECEDSDNDEEHYHALFMQDCADPEEDREESDEEEEQEESSEEVDDCDDTREWMEERVDDLMKELKVPRAVHDDIIWWLMDNDTLFGGCNDDESSQNLRLQYKREVGYATGVRTLTINMALVWRIKRQWSAVAEAAREKLYAPGGSYEKGKVAEYGEGPMAGKRKRGGE